MFSGGRSGISLYWNDEKLEVENYNGNRKIYQCGKELFKIEVKRDVNYYSLVIDVNDCAFGRVFRDGDVQIIFTDKSYVPGKHKKGGQSAKRYSKNRELAIMKWFKKINSLLMEYKDIKLVVGISHAYESTLMKYMHTYNKEKIIKTVRTEYCDENGVYQMVKKLK